MLACATRSCSIYPKQWPLRSLTDCIDNVESGPSHCGRGAHVHPLLIVLIESVAEIVVVRVISGADWVPRWVPRTGVTSLVDDSVEYGEDYAQGYYDRDHRKTEVDELLEATVSHTEHYDQHQDREETAAQVSAHT